MVSLISQYRVLGSKRRQQHPGGTSYHVCKLSHAQTVGLDALVGQDVVHQHQLAVVEPDLHALGLL